MSTHFHHAIEELQNQLLDLGAQVEESVHDAVRALVDRNADLAREVVQKDEAIDDMEVAIEEECLKILALHQPVAVDLRSLIAALKINNDLERIGDLAVNIAERAEFLAGEKPVDTNFDFAGMAEKAQWMLKTSLKAYVKVDTKLAHRVREADDEVDAMNREMYEKVEAGIRRSIDDVGSLIHLLSASRHLERIADLATNIAEDIIYMDEGEIVRHTPEAYAKTK